MRTKRRLPSYLRSLGLIILVMAAVALPSTYESSRFMALGAAMLGLVLIAAGIGLGIYYYKKNQRLRE